jgi:phage-related protein
MAKLFELYAELGMDASKFDKGVKAASKQGNTLASNVTSGLQTVSAKTIAMGHAMYDFAKTAARTAGNFVKDVIGSYADYEQLVGGVNKMFGDSAGDVISNAQRAYSTAGMSMNDYMQTVTSFSASLISSLKGDTVAAAKIADMALQDMSDNANTFGTDMASIQNAYQGFAKQNYTMLDNLKLGYGGTKTEMQRLLKDAQKIKRAQGENVKYSINNLDDVYEAIHVIQQEMKITGTTASEASQAISGSYHATMAAWSNIMTGLGTDQEMDQLIGGFVESGSNLVKNSKGACHAEYTLSDKEHAAAIFFCLFASLCNYPLAVFDIIVTEFVLAAYVQADTIKQTCMVLSIIYNHVMTSDQCVNC